MQLHRTRLRRSGERDVRHRRTTAVAAPTPMNRQACARLEYTHTACGRVRRAFVRHWNKLGANRRRKATEGNPRSAGQRSVMWERGATARPLTSYPTKARPPRTGGRAPVLRLHPNGKPHESANCSPGRQGHQSNSDHRSFGLTFTHGSRAPGLVRSGWVIARLLIRPPSPFYKTALPNPSLNRTHCGMRLKARHSILGL